MKLIAKTILFLLAITTLYSCATIFGRSSYQIRINSNPSSSFVILNDKGTEIEKGTTPRVVTLKSSAGYFKRASYRVKFTQPGYEERLVNIEARLNGWYIGNILIGGLIGMLIIDPASGAMYKLDILDVNEHLQPASGSRAEVKNSQLQILSVSDIPDYLKPKLIEIK